MDKQGQSVTTESQAGVTETKPRSLAISDVGIRTGTDFARLMSCLMSDIISGRVTPQVGHAACNAGGKLLKIVEMQYRYGTQDGTPGNRVLTLVPDLVPDAK